MTWHCLRGLTRNALICLVAALLPALAVSLWGFSLHAHAQAGEVRPEDVTTPAPSPVPLPTPTMTPAADKADTTKWHVDPSYASSSPGYVVQEGDTLWTAALEMGLDLDVMPCVLYPHFRPDNPLVIGDTLTAPDGEIICHEVALGDTIASIAAAYDVAPFVITDDQWNQLDVAVDSGQVPEPGRYVRIVRTNVAPDSAGLFAYMLERPVGESPMLAMARGGPVREPSRPLVPADWPYGSGYFEWPSTGWLTQGYRNDHRAIDIAAPLGTVVTAADRGVVVRAGWNDQGYGLFVIIDHNIDYVTLYSHLQDVYVAEGDIVAQGQPLGTVGSTGNSTGPHLHFEVRDFGSRINPLEVLLR